MRTRSQNEKILEWMRTKGAITQNDAKAAFGCTRLAARICDIKKKGYWIEDEYRRYTDDDGRPVMYKAYWLAEEDAEDG